MTLDLTTLNMKGNDVWKGIVFLPEAVAWSSKASSASDVAIFVSGTAALSVVP